jgi:hypothetical protein
MIARNKWPVCIGAESDSGSTAQICRNIIRVHVSYRAFLRARAFRPYVSGQSALIIDYATARRSDEPISTATTESTVQWLLHRRMGANQQMRWSPRGAHLMLKVRTSVINGTTEVPWSCLRYIPR